jgi:ABC-type uncharacterized transport system ATPase component
VEFRKTALFASKAKINIFRKKIWNRAAPKKGLVGGGNNKALSLAFELMVQPSVLTFVIALFSHF